MSGNPWHRRYHSDALAGMFPLTLEERGAYQTVLDLIYDRGGPIADNERLLAGHMNCSIRKWRSLRAALVEKGKLAAEDGKLSNSRAEKEIENDAKTSRKLAENGAKGGRAKAEKLKNDNENNGAGLAPPQAGSSLPEARSQKPEEEGEEDKNPLPHGSLVFAGRVIRLNRRDFDQWAETYHGIIDLRAELTALDDWLRDQDGRTQKNWFFVVSGALAKKHQAALKTQREGDDGRFSLPC